MRDKARIERVIKYIHTLWIENPDQRLGQLLYNYGGFTDCDYHIEDSITEEFLKQSLAKISEEYKK